MDFFKIKEIANREALENMVRLKGQSVTVGKSGGDYDTINSALTYVKAQSPTKTSRWTIFVHPGTYNEKIILADGIDLIGMDCNNTIITYSGTGVRTDDTVFAPYDCLVKNLTVIQDATSWESDLQNYPIHVDANREGWVLRLESCIFKSIGEFGHHAIGCGLHDDTKVIANECEFHSDGKAAVYIHNQANTTIPMLVKINNSIIYGCKVLAKTSDIAGVLVEDINSTTNDEIIITNSEIRCYANGGYDVQLRKHPSFTGNRNTLCVKLLNCIYNNFTAETDSGQIVTDKDIFCVASLPKTAYGKPVNISNNLANIPTVVLSAYADSEYVVGVYVPYLSGGYIRTVGIVDVLVDASLGAITKFAYLSTAANGYAKLGAIGTGKCFAVALTALASGQGYVKAIMVSHI